MNCKYSNVYSNTIITISLFIFFVSIININSIYAQTTTTTIPNFNFGSAGDWGCNSNTVATVNSIQNQNPELVLGLGDYSYQSSADCWLDRVDPLDEKMKITIGNHENTDSEDLDTYLDHFGMSSQYYSFNYQNVHFLSMATEISYSSGSSQNLFVKNDLASAAANPNIDWIVVYFHKPMYSSPNSCSSCDGESDLRDIYHPIFDQYGVDIVLEGHTHDYQRSFPIKFNPNSKSNPIITNNNINNYNDPQGQIYAIVGTGGVNFHSLDGKSSFIASQQSSRFGHLNIDIVNDGTTMVGKFISNEGGIMDQFTITKSTSSPPPPPAVEICDNRIDDDKDGKIDAEDLDCPSVSEICDNGLDDDRDGLIDSQDPDCQTIGYHYAPFFTATGSNKLDVPDSANLRLSSFTVATWFKTTATFPDEGVMVNKGGLGSESAGANQNYGIWFTPSETLQGGFETTGGTNRYITSTNTYNDGQWHHGVVTFDNSNNIVRLFVDGVQIGTLSTTSNPDNTGSQPLRIGGNAQSLTEDFFIGQLDEVGVWNRALTSAEIINLKNNGVFVPNGLVYNNSFSSPPAVEICDNRIDDDKDGKIDAEDLDCPSVSEICDNGLDDDRDGLIDSQDPDCTSSGTGYSYEPFLTVSSQNDVVSIPSTQNLKLSQFSISSWFKTTSNFGDESFIVNKGGLGTDSSGSNMNYGIWITSSEKVQGGFETSSGSNNYVTSPSSYNDGQWHHSVITFNGSVLRLYVDGVQVATLSTSSTPETAGNNPLKIGANSRIADGLFTGSIDEVGVWNRALTPTEITNLMNNGTFSINGLVYGNSFN